MPELAPALVAVDHLALEQERAAEELGRLASPRRPPPGRGCGSRRPSRPRPPPAAPRASRTRRASAGSRRCPWRPCRSGSSPPPTRGSRPGARPAPRSTKLLGALLGEAAVERDHHQLLDPSPAIRSRLTGNGVEQLGRRLRVDHRERVRVEGQHRVDAADHLAVAEVHAVEGADGDLARARAGLDVGELGDLHAGSNTTTGWSSSARGSRDREQLARRPSAARTARRAGRPATRRPWRTARRLGLGRGRRSGRNASASPSGTSRSGRRPRAGRGRSPCARARSQ